MIHIMASVSVVLFFLAGTAIACPIKNENSNGISQNGTKTGFNVTVYQCSNENTKMYHIRYFIL